jgi:hypothetical protein
MIVTGNGIPGYSSSSNLREKKDNPFSCSPKYAIRWISTGFKKGKIRAVQK